MSRLVTAGAETRSHFTEGLTAGTGTVAYSTTTKRTGAVAFSAAGGTTSNFAYFPITTVAGRHYYYRAYINLTGYPSNVGNNDTIGFLGSSNQTIGVLDISNTGVLTFWSGTGATGSGNLSTISLNTWYRIEIHLMVPSSGSGTAELVLDGTSLYSATQNVGTTLPTRLAIGWIQAGGSSTGTIFIDDVALNDDQGTAQNSFPGAGAVRVLVPTADSAIGSGWLAGGGGTTSLFAAVDNEPPIGAATATNTSQIKNATNTSSANYDVTLQDYLTAGVSSTDTIALVQQITVESNSSTTATNYNISVVSNPAIGEYTTAPSVTAIASAYPTGWKLDHGSADGTSTSTGVVYNPTVTLGTAPVMRIGKRSGTTRILYSCFMGLMVESVPSSGVSIAGTASGVGTTTLSLSNNIQGTASGDGSSTSLTLSLGGIQGTASGSGTMLMPLGGGSRVAVYVRGTNFADGSFGYIFNGPDPSGPPATAIPGAIPTNYNYQTQGTYTYLSGRGHKIARLTFLWERVQHSLGAALDTTEVGRLKQQADFAANAGMQLILDCHNYCYYYDATSTNTWRWGSGITAAQFADFWGKMSAAFKGYHGIYAYDLQNEPHDLSTDVNVEAYLVESFTQAAVNAIRANGDTTLIHVPGASTQQPWNWKIYHPDKWIKDPANNFKYAFHLYVDKIESQHYTTCLTDATNAGYASLEDRYINDALNRIYTWASANGNAPLYLGETGWRNDDTTQWDTFEDNFLTSLDTNNVGGTIWQASERYSGYVLNVYQSNGVGTTIGPPLAPATKLELHPSSYITAAWVNTLWLSSAESQNATTEQVTLTSGTGSTIAFDTTVPHLGSYAYKSALTASTATARWQHSVAGQMGWHYYSRVYYYVPALPSAAVNIFAWMVNSDTDSVAVTLNTDGSLTVWIGPTSTSGGTIGTIAAGGWVCLESHIYIPASGNGMLEWRLNGTLTGNSSQSVAVGSTALSGIWGGITSASASVSTTVYTDDMMLNLADSASSTAWPGLVDNTVTITATSSGSASGTGLALSVGTVSKTVTDSGSGTDAIAVSATLTVTQTGAGGDSATVAATLSIAQTGAGVDSTSVGVPISIAETGAGAEALSFGTIATSVAETGAGVDSIVVSATLPTLAQTGAGVDALSIAATVSVGETGSGLESTTSLPAVQISETGSGADSVSVAVSLTIAQTGSGVDTLAESATLAVVDSGSGVDGLSVGVPITVGDTGAGADALTVLPTVPISQTGTGVDSQAVSASVPIADSGSGIDAITVSVVASVAQTASGLDVITVVYSVLVFETGAGVDGIAIVVPQQQVIIKPTGTSGIGGVTGSSTLSAGIVGSSTLRSVSGTGKVP